MTPYDFSQTVTIVNPSGLHARAAGKLSSLADKFQATIWVEKDKQTASTDSILDLMMLMASQGDTVTIKATGSDAKAALAAVSALVADGFGEGVL